MRKNPPGRRSTWWNSLHLCWPDSLYPSCGWPSIRVQERPVAVVIWPEDPLRETEDSPLAFLAPEQGRGRRMKDRFPKTLLAHYPQPWTEGKTKCWAWLEAMKSPWRIPCHHCQILPSVDGRAEDCDAPLRGASYSAASPPDVCSY